MPEYLAPAVYVEEIQTGNKPIEGVSTSTAGLVGVTERGPVNVPQLVTSYGEHQRIFGGYLPADEFTDGTGRVHAYLPHAVEGFFLNGGKRAYITRVLPDVATPSTRNLFFADPALLNPGNSVLLRAAQQGTGTAVNPPLLYVLDPANFAVGDWVRIGDGSRAEYLRIATLGVQRHVAFNFPLSNAHGDATPARAIAGPLPTLPALADAVFDLVNPAVPDDTELVINNGDDVTLVATLPAGSAPAAWLVVQVGTGASAEYPVATGATALGGGQVRLTLAQPLRLPHAGVNAVTILDTTGGTLDALDLAANAGESLAYIATSPTPAIFTVAGNLIVFEPGTATQEAHRIGALASLPLLLPLVNILPAGATAQGVTVADDGAVTAKALTADAAVGAISIALNDRVGIAENDVLRVGVNEFVIVRQVVGERGAPPDAGAVILERPLSAGYTAGTVSARELVTVDTGRQSVTVLLAAPADADNVLVGDGTNYALGDVVRFTLPDGSIMFHRLGAAPAPAAPIEVELSGPLTFGHEMGLPLVERTPLLEVRALDAGSWGNRLMVGCRNETTGLVPNAEVLNVNPPVGPGTFSSVQMTSLTGVEPGTVLEMLDPNGDPINVPLLKVRRIDRSNRLALLDPPGLQAAHINAHNAAILAGQRLRLRSREFSLMVLLRQRPDPAVPARDENLLDQEVFRNLSMDPRHSRYVMRIVGATWTPPTTTDDLGLPLRRWDRRSEGTSSYVRVLDLEPVPVSRQAIRLGPEPLVDMLRSGLTRPARHPLSGGDDAVVTMNDAMYAGADAADPDDRTGIYTLKNLLNVSLTAIPGQTTAALQQTLIDHCEEMRYRFAVLDGPFPPNDTVTDIQNFRQQYDTKYAAVYHPWLSVPDPFPTSLSTIRQYPVPPSGHMLGIYARVDNDRGVHKAPANEVVRGITGLTRYFTKGEQDILNPYPSNINLLRDFRPNNRGLRVWGARCITSDNDFKYVNVRRLLIFIEDSIDRGLQWVVFEPNAEELWARVRRAVTNFLTTVWRNGALEGVTPEQGFFVKCDRTTMTRDDIDNGRLICVIGVAPVKPAEFVIIRIGLWTADSNQ